MRYRLALPEPHDHLLHVETTVDSPGEACELVLPVWTPGSYLVREFARHLEGIAAEDGEGRPLAVERRDKHRLLLRARGAARAVLRCRVYANELTVRTCHVDGTHAFVNGAAVFPYAPGREGERHVLEVAPPPGWRVSTALEGGPTEFIARDYDELVDSPLEIGTHRSVAFEALGKAHEIAIWGRGNLDEARLAADVRRIVETLGALMGGLPYERYLFILHLAEKRRGGLEHARSTTLDVGRMEFFPREKYEETLGLFAHEYFHLWNVKRLRPAALVPYDYAREQYTRLLWWFEGATSYYEQVALSRAGILSPARRLEVLGEALTALERTPGARKMSLEEASFLAWVKHYRPDENTPNSAISYYLKGELVAFALDLALRGAGRSLDELLRTLYARHAAGGLPEDGVEAAAAELLGDAAARRFFDRFVRGVEPARARPRRDRPAPAAADVPRPRRQGRDPAPERRRRAAGGLPRRGPPERPAAPGEVGAGGEPGAPGRPLRRGRDRGGGRLPRGPRRALGPPARAGPGREARLTVFRRDELLEVRGRARGGAGGRGVARAAPGRDGRAAAGVRGVVRGELPDPVGSAPARGRAPL